MATFSVCCHSLLNIVLTDFCLERLRFTQVIVGCWEWSWGRILWRHEDEQVERVWKWNIERLLGTKKCSLRYISLAFPECSLSRLQQQAREKLSHYIHVAGIYTVARINIYFFPGILLCVIFLNLSTAKQRYERMKGDSLIVFEIHKLA